MKKSLPKSKEDGPWKVKVWKFDFRTGRPAILPYGSESAYEDVVVASEDFTHDVHLEIRGDFKDFAEKKRYAHLLAKKLNSK